MKVQFFPLLFSEISEKTSKIVKKFLTKLWNYVKITSFPPRRTLNKNYIMNTCHYKTVVFDSFGITETKPHPKPFPKPSPIIREP